MAILRRTQRVVHAACGHEVLEVMTVPATYAVEAIDFGTAEAPNVVFESGESRDADVRDVAPVEHLCYWCDACGQSVPEPELVPDWEA